MEEVKRLRGPRAKQPLVLGFREGCSVAMLTDVAMELLAFGAAWNEPVAVATMGVLTVFELIMHRALVG
eukprot:10682659-Lingulodinium_polyedra.AAC.1